MVSLCQHGDFQIGAFLQVQIDPPPNMIDLNLYYQEKELKQI